MDKSFVTESAEQLTEMAEKDIVTVKLLIDKKFHPEDYMYNIICFHATQAVEKLLKSYIINNSKNIEKTHDLDYLHKVATEIDASFIKIKNDCIWLNKFCPKIKYSTENTVTKQNINDIIKSLNAICNFPPIKTMRDSFGKGYKYEIVSEVTAGSVNK
jgi:HEPN domain-containing protein